jgi:hypothetical protein
MTDPPKKEGRLCSTALHELRMRAGYQALDLLQPGNVWTGWGREAARMFYEYCRTGGKRHLVAFYRHVQSMRAHRARGGQ